MVEKALKNAAAIGSQQATLWSSFYQMLNLWEMAQCCDTLIVRSELIYLTCWDLFVLSVHFWIYSEHSEKGNIYRFGFFLSGELRIFLLQKCFCSFIL